MTDTVDEVKTALMDVDYPATKDDLLAAAERQEANEDAVRALRSIPPVDYRNEAEVLRSIDVPPSGASSEGDSPNPGLRRVHTKPGLAQHMKDVESTPIEKELGSNDGS